MCGRKRDTSYSIQLPKQDMGPLQGLPYHISQESFYNFDSTPARYSPWESGYEDYLKRDGLWQDLTPFPIPD